MPHKFRTLLEIRKAACPPSLAKRAQDYFLKEGFYEGLRSRLRYQSDRLQAVLDFYEVKKLADVPAVDREVAEGAAAGKQYWLVRFSEVHLGQAIENLNPDKLVTEFNANFRRELEKEIETVLEYLRPAYAAGGVETELDHNVPPVRTLRMHHERAGGCNPGMGVHTIASCFRDLLR